MKTEQNETDWKTEVIYLRRIIVELMPFVLDDYFPDCVMPEYKRVVEPAKAVAEAAMAEGMEPTEWQTIQARFDAERQAW